MTRGPGHKPNLDANRLGLPTEESYVTFIDVTERFALLWAKNEVADHGKESVTYKRIKAKRKALRLKIRFFERILFHLRRASFKLAAMEEAYEREVTKIKVIPAKNNGAKAPKKKSVELTSVVQEFAKMTPEKQAEFLEALRKEAANGQK